MKRIRPALAALTFLAAPALAAVGNVTPSGFLITLKSEVKSPPGKVFAALRQVGQWWNGDHTYSGSAAAMSLDMRAGGCFCERWNQNSIEHARVIYVAQDKALRMEGSLGPLQEMAVNGILNFSLAPAGDGTALVFTYRVRGPADAALDKLAAIVDRVMAEQVSRLVRFVETGAAVPVAAPPPMQDRFFSSEGVRLRYVEEGTGADAVILLHDAGADIESQWVASGVMPLLARQQIFRVVALDLRGHGKSERGGTEGAEMAEDVVRLMAHLGIERAHFVGYGLGAQVAAYIAVKQPARVITTTLAAGAHARTGGLAVSPEEMGRISKPTLAIVGTADPAIAEMHALRRAMPQLWRFTLLNEETRATTVRSDEFVTAVQYFLRYHPGRLVK